VWRLAQPITDFKEWQPTEGGEPKFPSEARVAYDAANLYVFIRAFDPHPDSIIRQLARRDSWLPGDRVGVMVDSYHDRRSGYEFWVNPVGVKVDAAIYDDGNEDDAWDAVWDVATRIDSLGWTAEFRIPLSQLRYGADRSHTFGFVVLRDIYRFNQRLSWPLFHVSRAGMVSQFGELTGLEDLEAPRRLEAAPYLVAKNETSYGSDGFGRRQDATVGGDIKYRVASNLTLDATVNPDFGQVEADPGVYNLTAYESFFSERRPFFVAGRGLFRFDVNCTAVNDCSTGEGLFYSRRIGRTPSLSGVYNAATQPPTRILGAAKLTGRLPGGLTLGMFDAVTQRAAGQADTTYEPATNFAVVRLRQDLRHGESSVGGMVTAVNRGMDRFSAPYLHRSAYAGAIDFRHRLPGRTYEISGSLDFSRVAGSPQAIAGTQQSSVHYFQRPDRGLAVDSTRTALSGDAEELTFGKVGGQHLLFQTSVQRRSAGFEVNDLGYLQRADQVTWSTWAGYFDRHQRRLYNRFQWNWNWWQFWTARGLPEERAFNSNVHLTLRNNWSVHMGGTLGQLGTTYCYDCSRGGPAVRQDPYLAPWGGINGDDRHALVPYLWVNYFTGDAGHNRSLSLSPELDLKVSSQFSSALSVNYRRNTTDNQWYGLYADSSGAPHYTFAHLEQQLVGITLRVNYTITPALSLQVYAQPFVTKGTFSTVRELSSTPRAAHYDDRYQPYGDTAVTNNPGGFKFMQFQSNVVFRWEYLPGSTLFLVWSQGRQDAPSADGTSITRTDFRNLFHLHPANTLLVKVSYWINR
jgi:hypothetical protein